MEIVSGKTDASRSAYLIPNVEAVPTIVYFDFGHLHDVWKTWTHPLSSAPPPNSLFFRFSTFNDYEPVHATFDCVTRRTKILGRPECILIFSTR